MDKHTESRLPPSSTALIALASLTPPSPILDSSQLPTTLTSGDIPILFDLIAETSPFSCISRTDDEGMTGFGVLLGDGINTLETVGTSGCTDKVSEYYVNAPSSLPLPLHGLCTQKPGEVETPGAILAPSRSSLPEIYHEIQQITESESCYAPFENNTPDEILRPSEKEPSPPTGIRNSPITINNENKPPNGFILTPQSCLNSHAALNHLPLSSNTLTNLRPSSQQQNASSLPTSTSCDTFVNIHTRKMVVAATLARLESAMCESTPPSPQAKKRSENVLELTKTSKPQAPLPKLPRHLNWLHDTTVELLIDQEGFRSVHARFKFSGYSKQTFDARDDGEAQFRPTTRQIFYFHYAPFDGLPVLRRITINEEESRDYISRQASLSLKSNGVYTVRGSEVSSTPTPYEQGPRTHHGSDPTKLSWRFDYLVGDRYDVFSNAGKRFNDGEKILTPLTFSCSPLLLHFLQGKRVKLLHIVKKSVATKLVAEKMEPPTLASPIPKTVITQLPIDSHDWNIHRRAKSHAPHQELTKKKFANVCNQEFPFTGNRSIHSGDNSKIASNPISIRRRRASSAGE